MKYWKGGGGWKQAKKRVKGGRKLTWCSQARPPDTSATKSMYISGCGTLAMGCGGGRDPDCPRGGTEEALLVMRGTRWGALSSAGKRMASKDTILSIAVDRYKVVYKDKKDGGEPGKVGEEREGKITGGVL